MPVSLSTPGLRSWGPTRSTARTFSPHRSTAFTGPQGGCPSLDMQHNCSWAFTKLSEIKGTIFFRMSNQRGIHTNGRWGMCGADEAVTALESQPVQRRPLSSAPRGSARCRRSPAPRGRAALQTQPRVPRCGGEGDSTWIGAGICCSHTSQPQRREMP